jgi:hypothetical protein
VDAGCGVAVVREHVLGEVDQMRLSRGGGRGRRGGRVGREEFEKVVGGRQRRESERNSVRGRGVGDVPCTASAGALSNHPETVRSTRTVHVPLFRQHLVLWIPARDDDGRPSSILSCAKRLGGMRLELPVQRAVSGAEGDVSISTVDETSLQDRVRDRSLHGQSQPAELHHVLARQRRHSFR